MPRKSSSSHFSGSQAFAALSVELAAGAAPTEFRLIPMGRFKADDGSGRPLEVPEGWLLDAAGAAQLAAASTQRRSPRMIDYEHQSFRAAEPGQLAPASGWLGRLEARADGLWAVDVEWTERAAALIAAREYRYISPVFPYDKKTGRVTAVLGAALTNDPGLDGLTDLARLSALYCLSDFSTTTPEEIAPMKALLLALGLAETATEAEALAALSAIKTPLTAAQAEVAALKAQLDEKSTAVATLTAQATATGTGVPMAQFVALQNELAALSGKMQSDEHAKLFKEGFDDGRILPAVADYWRSQPLAVLSGYLAVAKPLSALGGTQTGGNPAGGVSPAGSAQITGEGLAVMKALGLTAEEFAAAKPAL